APSRARGWASRGAPSRARGWASRRARDRDRARDMDRRTTDQHRGVLKDRRNFLRTSGVAAGVGFTTLAVQGTASAAPVRTEQDEQAAIVPDPPDGALVIIDGTLRVRLHPQFPQVVDYVLDGARLAGRYGAAHTTVTI